MNICSYDHSKPLAKHEVDGLAELFRTFGDPTRIRLLCALQAGPLCVTDLMDQLGLEQSAVSHQLAILRRSRLVRSSRSGRQMYYELDDGHVVSLLDVAIEHVQERPWNS